MPSIFGSKIVIVGSGPAGYTAGLYAARAGLKPIILGGSITAGGALMNTTEVENFPGFPDGIMGPDLMENMRQQALNFGATIVNDDVETFELDGDVKKLTVGSGDIYEASAVILATGSHYRKLGVEGEDKYSGRGVSWCATCDGFFFRGKTVAVVGGGDSAMEEAQFLTKFADKVVLIHRRDQFRASKIMVQRTLENPKIEIMYNTEIVSIGSDNGSNANHVILSGDNEDRYDLDGVFIAIGHDPRSELFKDQIHVDAEGYVITAAPSTATNIPGVYACGDLVDKTYRQAITSSGTGCSAALDAQHYVDGLADAPHVTTL